jgi:hypothetical protein
MVQELLAVIFVQGHLQRPELIGDLENWRLGLGRMLLLLHRIPTTKILYPLWSYMDVDLADVLDILRQL